MTLKLSLSIFKLPFRHTARILDFHSQREFFMVTRKVGRDAGDGRFIPVEKARKDKEGAVVEKIKYPDKPAPPKKSK